MFRFFSMLLRTNNALPFPHRPSPTFNMTACRVHLRRCGFCFGSVPTVRPPTIWRHRRSHRVFALSARELEVRESSNKRGESETNGLGRALERGRECERARARASGKDHQGVVLCCESGIGCQKRKAAAVAGSSKQAHTKTGDFLFR